MPRGSPSRVLVATGLSARPHAVWGSIRVRGAAAGLECHSPATRAAGEDQQAPVSVARWEIHRPRPLACCAETLRWKRFIAGFELRMKMTFNNN